MVFADFKDSFLSYFLEVFFFFSKENYRARKGKEDFFQMNSDILNGQEWGLCLGESGIMSGVTSQLISTPMEYSVIPSEQEAQLSSFPRYLQ